MEISFREFRRSIEHRLRRRGINASDARRTTLVLWSLGVFDHGVFGKTSVGASFGTGERDPEMPMLGYLHDTGQGAPAVDEYRIHATGFTRWFRGARRALPIFLVTPSEGASLRAGRLVLATHFEAMTALAAHEVRHRVQRKRPELKMYQPSKEPSAGELFSVRAAAWSICRSQWASHCRRAVQASLPKRMLESHLSQEEFDAYVVETIILNLVHADTHPDTLYRLIGADA